MSPTEETLQRLQALVQITLAKHGIVAPGDLMYMRTGIAMAAVADDAAMQQWVLAHPTREAAEVDLGLGLYQRAATEFPEAVQVLRDLFQAHGMAILEAFIGTPEG
jgi:hypothetical protein